jgi:hypothetical protein
MLRLDSSGNLAISTAVARFLSAGAVKKSRAQARP